MSKVRELYVIKDLVADEFGPVYEATNRAVALRQFRQAIAKSPYPDDFELYCIGYVDEDMKITPEVEIIVLPDPNVVELVRD